MQGRRSEYDVTNRVDVTNPDAVCNEVCTLLARVYPKVSNRPVKRAFQVASTLFRGEYPGYHPCDTPYHDLQHTLDVTLTMARLLCGYEQARKQAGRLGPELTMLGVIVSLFHDSGYVRRLGDHRHSNGAAYTRTHVTRGGNLLAVFLPEVGMAGMIPVARKLIHFTGYEMDVPAIPLYAQDQRVLGKLLGSADLLAQMSDRCYLEKCRDRLYPEFVAAGMAGPDVENSPYHSPEELIYKTPKFFQHVLHDRLGNVLNGVHSYVRMFFLPERDFYGKALEQNYAYLEHITNERNISLLRRQPPWTLVVKPDQSILAA